MIFYLLNYFNYVNEPQIKVKFAWAFNIRLYVVKIWPQYKNKSQLLKSACCESILAQYLLINVIKNRNQTINTYCLYYDLLRFYLFFKLFLGR